MTGAGLRKIVGGVMIPVSMYVGDALDISDRFVNPILYMCTDVSPRFYQNIDGLYLDKTTENGERVVYLADRGTNARMPVHADMRAYDLADRVEWIGREALRRGGRVARKVFEEQARDDRALLTLVEEELRHFRDYAIESYHRIRRYIRNNL
ncbi:MAG: hypothetical protein ABH879_00650 [archaeon]